MSGVERVHIQSADETHIASHHAVSVAVSHVRLGDGRAALLPAELRSCRVLQVHVAVVAHGEVAHLQSVAVEVEHGEIAHRSLRLPPLRCEHDVGGGLSQSHKMEVLAADGHAERFATVLPHRHRWVVGVVHPINPWRDVQHHGVIVCSVGEVCHRLLEIVEEKWFACHGFIRQ